ncbi:hypothetical protein SEUCBS139899_008512 [Sporothrix eucalyptigena]|uniref:Uncharacterized protein n=1 Tax=Sporothrix eucalyptigena TaxID=1812306 RepID=A0ABP0B111_9PEZI
MDHITSLSSAGHNAAPLDTTQCASPWNRVRSFMARPWFCLLVMATAVTAATSSPAGQQQLLDSNDTAWHRYVRAPAGKTVVPARILAQYTTGNVTNAGGLLGSGTDHDSGPTVLTRLASGDDIPTLVIDFGLNVAGLLSIDFAGSYNTTAGFPGITLAFSETIQYLTDRSDFTRSDNAAGSAKLTKGTDQVRHQLNGTGDSMVITLFLTEIN